MPTMMSARSSRAISSRMAGVSTGWGTSAPYHRCRVEGGGAVPAPFREPMIRLGRDRMGLSARLAGLTTSGRARVAVAWSMYDFANTIFSFAVVSGAIGLWLVSDSRFGERDGNFVLSVAVVVSVGLNALVSPILGALSDRGGRRLPFLLFFTALCIVPTVLIGGSSPRIGVLLFIGAHLGYQ